jgi:hypothetical protein
MYPFRILLYDAVMHMLRYTGFSQGQQETYKKTPFMAQLERKVQAVEGPLSTQKYTKY